MRRDDRRLDGPISREQLEFLAAISPEWRDEQRRREHAASEAGRERELDDFVRAITVPDWSNRGPSPASGPSQKFIEAITSPEWASDERPITPEEIDSFVEAITGRGESSILERDWNAARHPRVPKGQPGGGQWTTAGGASSGGSSAYASDSASNTPTASLAAWHPPVGHHWVPYGVVQDQEIRSLLSDDAVHYAAGGYSGPTDPHHGNKTLDAVTHRRYNEQVKKELQAFMRKNGISKGNKMTAAQMERFANLIENGLGADGKPNDLIRRYNSTIKGIVKNGPKPASNLDDVVTAGRKYMKQRGFKMLAAGAVLSNVVGEVVASEIKGLHVVADSPYYKRALGALQAGDIATAHRLLTDTSDSLYLEINGRVGATAALNFKTRMDDAFDAAMKRTYD